MSEESTDSPEEMSEESTDSPEEQRRMTRRRLMKLGAYTIPIVTSIVVFNDEILGKTCHPSCGPAGGCQPS